MEVLLVAAMTAVIAVTVLGAFSNGLKLWNRSNRLVVESDIAIFFDKMGEDLRDVQVISTIPFKGITTETSFPTIVLTPADTHGSRAQEETVDQIGAVQYRFDPADGKIYRAQANYGQAIKTHWSEPMVIASGIDDVVIHYYFPSTKGLVVKSLADESLPAGLMVELRFTDEGQERHMRRFLPVMVGGS